jgi:hypothetical protein
VDRVLAELGWLHAECECECAAGQQAQRERAQTCEELQRLRRARRPATPDQHRFYAALLYELGAPDSATLSVLERLARDLLRHIAPRMLVVDQVHHFLPDHYRISTHALR